MDNTQVEDGHDDKSATGRSLIVPARFALIALGTPASIPSALTDGASGVPEKPKQLTKVGVFAEDSRGDQCTSNEIQFALLLRCQRLIRTPLVRARCGP